MSTVSKNSFLNSDLNGTMYGGKINSGGRKQNEKTMQIQVGVTKIQKLQGVTQMQGDMSDMMALMQLK